MMESLARIQGQSNSKQSFLLSRSEMVRPRVGIGNDELVGM
jgi:hypothetical protein